MYLIFVGNHIRPENDRDGQRIVDNAKGSSYRCEEIRVTKEGPCKSQIKLSTYCSKLNRHTTIEMSSSFRNKCGQYSVCLVSGFAKETTITSKSYYQYRNHML